MNEELAKLYGTNASVGSSYDVDALEKMAQFALLSKEAAAAGVDLTQLTPEEQEYVLSEMTKEAAAPAPDQDARAKLEEADYIGRVIAHSFWQEKTAIEKQAGKVSEIAGKALEAIKSAPGKAYEGTLGRVGGAAEKAVSERLRKGGLPEAAKRVVHRVGGSGAKPGTSTTYREGGKRLSHGANVAAQIAAGTAATGAVGAGAYGAHKGVQALRDKKEKDASAFDTLVDQRAYEILAASGLVQEDGSVVPPYVEKQAEASEFDTLVDQTALNYLAELGYQVG